MLSHRLAILAAAAAIVGGTAGTAAAQADDDAPAITARVHGTFVDASGGAGVVSGDMAILRFEVRNGSLTAIGLIVGAMADAAGNVLGQVREELTLSTSNVASTCNQLRLDLAATDADVLGTRVHFNRETAGFDSRQGTTPKALRVLCAAGQAIRENRAPEAQARALNEVAAAVKSGASR